MSDGDERVWVQCGMCQGQGGSWQRKEGQTAGQSLDRWVNCHGCNGEGGWWK